MNHTPINLVIAINQLYVKYAYVMLYSFFMPSPGACIGLYSAS